MALRKPQALKQFVMDGEVSHAPADARIADVVAPDVSAVQVIESDGRSRMLARSDFNAPVPEGFTTYQTAVARGSGRVPAPHKA
jgi:hypothetical protein